MDIEIDKRTFRQSSTYYIGTLQHFLEVRFATSKAALDILYKKHIQPAS